MNAMQLIEHESYKKLLAHTQTVHAHVENDNYTIEELEELNKALEENSKTYHPCSWFCLNLYEGIKRDQILYQLDLVEHDINYFIFF